MSQYFFWMNFDRHERLDTTAHDSLFDSLSTSYIGAEYTEAALTMLEGEWAGEAVLFMGDYADLSHAANPLLARIREEYGNHPFDYADETFTNISGRFRESEGRMEHVWADDDTEFDRPYAGPFDLHYTHPRYVINRTRHEYVDRAATCVWYVRRTPSFEVVRFDPTPLLFITTRGLDGYEDDEHGPWVGDDVTAGNALPAPGYTDTTKEYVYRRGDNDVPVYATDRQIKAVWRRRTEDYGDLTADEFEAIRALLQRC